MHALRLYRDRLPAKAPGGELPAGPVRALYVVEGALAVRERGLEATLGANSAWSSTGTTRIAGGSLASVVLRWELGRREDRSAPALAGAASELALEAPLSLPEGEAYLLRCDRVDFPPGGEALLHTHQGPGIRCLLRGSIRIESEGAVHRYGPLEPWFESGPAPVYAAADARAETAFARVMVLPRRLLGASSIQYVRPEDRDRPKSQRYQVFVDRPIELP